MIRHFSATRHDIGPTDFQSRPDVALRTYITPAKVQRLAGAQDLACYGRPKMGVFMTERAHANNIGSLCHSAENSG
jgi:hypothetical protein